MRQPVSCPYLADLRARYGGEDGWDATTLLADRSARYRRIGAFLDAPAD